MPAAVCELFATGQDEHADAHLGAVLEWLKPANGQIFYRILRAEDQPASSSTSPPLDNEKLVPLNEALRTAQRARDAPTTARVTVQIEKILCREVGRRDRARPRGTAELAD